MANRLVSVGDDFNLPGAVNVLDENLPANLQPAALSATFASAVNVLGFGASTTATAAANVTALRAAVTKAKATNAAVYVPSNAFGAPLQINDRIDISGVHIFGDGRWSRIQQNAAPNGIFYTNLPDTVIQGLNLSSSAGRDPSNASNSETYCAIFIEAAAHRTIIRNVSGGGMNSLVNIPTTTAALNVGLLVDGVEASDVAFAVAGRGLQDATIQNVRGTYSQGSATSAPPHLVYIAQMAGTVPRSINVNIRNVEAWDGTKGEPVKVSGTDGGTVSNLTARNCRGLLNILDVKDVAIRGIESVDDNASSVAGTGPLLPSIGILDSTRVRLSGARVKFKNIDHMEPISTSNSTDCTLEDVDLVCNLVTANTGAAVVKAYGTNNTFENFRITSVGADTGHAFLVTGAGTKIRNPVVSGNIKNGVFTSTGATSTSITYDPKNVSVKQTLSGKAVWVDATTGERPRLVTPAIHNQIPESPVAYFGAAFRGATDHDGLTFWESGHLVTKLQAWQWDSGASAGIYNTNGSSNAACTVDTGIANMDIEGAIVYNGTTAGLAIRKVDDSNFIIVGLQAGAVVVQTREAGVNTTQATVAATNTSGRKYTLRATVYGNLIDVFLDGVKVLTHTLTAPHQALYGAATAHGVYVAGSTTARFRWARIRSLT